MTAAECRSEAVKCARRVDVLMAAKEYVLAKEMLATAKEWTLRAVRIEQGEADVFKPAGDAAARVAAKAGQSMLAREDQDNAPSRQRRVT